MTAIELIYLTNQEEPGLCIWAMLFVAVLCIAVLMFLYNAWEALLKFRNIETHGWPRECEDDDEE